MRIHATVRPLCSTTYPIPAEITQLKAQDLLGPVTKVKKKKKKKKKSRVRELRVANNNFPAGISSRVFFTLVTFPGRSLSIKRREYPNALASCCSRALRSLPCERGACPYMRGTPVPAATHGMAAAINRREMTRPRAVPGAISHPGGNPGANGWLL